MAQRPRSDRHVMDEALAEVRAVYDTLAERPVERRCVRRADCCRFKRSGRTPYLTAGEALLAAAALRAAGRKRLPRRDSEDGACPLLESGDRCLIYDSRPFGCRTHFCRPAGGPYARRDVQDLIRRLDAVDAALKGRGPVALPSAVEAALRQWR